MNESGGASKDKKATDGSGVFIPTPRERDEGLSWNSQAKSSRPKDPIRTPTRQKTRGFFDLFRRRRMVDSTLHTSDAVLEAPLDAADSVSEVTTAASRVQESSLPPVGKPDSGSAETLCSKPEDPVDEIWGQPDTVVIDPEDGAKSAPDDAADSHEDTDEETSVWTEELIAALVATATRPTPAARFFVTGLDLSEIAEQSPLSVQLLHWWLSEAIDPDEFGMLEIDSELFPAPLRSFLTYLTSLDGSAREQVRQAANLLDARDERLREFEQVTSSYRTLDRVLEALLRDDPAGARHSFQNLTVDSPAAHFGRGPFTEAVAAVERAKPFAEIPAQALPRRTSRLSPLGRAVISGFCLPSTSTAYRNEQNRVLSKARGDLLNECDDALKDWIEELCS